MDFQTYCEDILNLSPALMSHQQMADARIAFADARNASKAQAAPKHKDAGLKLPELLAKVVRLTDGDTSGSKAAELFGTPVQIPIEQPNREAAE